MKQPVNGGIGGNWSGETGSYLIASNRLDPLSGGYLFWNVASFGASQEAYVTLANVDTAGAEHDLLLKSQSATAWSNGVIEVWYDHAGSRAQVWTYTSAQGWVQRGADIPATFANGDQFGAKAKADGQVEVYKNGALLATRDVTVWPYYANGGYIGLWALAANQALFDDFDGGTVAGGYNGGAKVFAAPAIGKLDLTATCSLAPGMFRQWRVRNPNSFAMPYTAVLAAPGPFRETVTGTVPPAENGQPGVTFFVTAAQSRENKVELYANGRWQDVEASSGTQCASAREAFTVYDLPQSLLAKIAFDPLAANPSAFAPQALSGTPPSYQHTLKYDYDGLYRLTGANYCWGYVAACPASNAYRDYNYSYDLMGNRKTAQEWANGLPTQDFTYNYNLANQLTTSVNNLTDQTTGYQYDLAGRLTSYGSTTLEWDAENRLTTYTEPGRTTTYAYTGYGDRYRQTVNGVATDYLLDYNTDLTQVLAETTNSQTTTYLSGIGQQTSAGWQYFSTDGLGSVREMTDASGAVTYATSYEPYGTPFEQWPNPQAASAFGYTGESTDANSLVYLRARYYDPRLGTFLSKDPFEGVMTRSGSLNGYNYVEGNPANYTDPSGNCIFGIDTAICVGVLVGAIVGGTIAFGTDVAIQHYWEGQSWDELNWRRAFIAGGVGAITGGITGGFGAWAVGAVEVGTLSATQAAVSSFALDVGLGVVADTVVYRDDVGSALVSNIAGNIAGDIAGRAVGRAFRGVRGIFRELDSLSFAGIEAWPEFTPHWGNNNTALAKFDQAFAIKQRLGPSALAFLEHSPVARTAKGWSEFWRMIGADEGNLNWVQRKAQDLLTAQGLGPRGLADNLDITLRFAARLADPNTPEYIAANLDDATGHVSILHALSKRFNFPLLDGFHDLNKFRDLQLILLIAHNDLLSDPERALLNRLHNDMYAHHYAWEKHGIAIWEAAYDKLIALRYRSTYRQPASWEAIAKQIENEGPESGRPLWYTYQQKEMLLKAWKNLKVFESEYADTAMRVYHKSPLWYLVQDFRDPAIRQVAESGNYVWGMQGLERLDLMRMPNPTGKGMVPTKFLLAINRAYELSHYGKLP